MKISLEMGSSSRRGNRNTLTWISRNQSVEIAGRLINAGMIYVADALPEAFEASAINRRLQVGQAVIGDYEQLEDTRQLQLFFQEDEKIRGLFYAMDRVNNTYGLDSLMPAALRYSVEGKTHFLERS